VLDPRRRRQHAAFYQFWFRYNDEQCEEQWLFDKNNKKGAGVPNSTTSCQRQDIGGSGGRFWRFGFCRIRRNYIALIRSSPL
jgi:hypothetical protein